MSFSQHACRQAVRQRLSRSTDHVWISDDLVSNALHRFIIGHCSRRHVSFAPGPLEARKRSAKRRMMNMAVAGGVGATDVGTFMGIGGGLEQIAWRWESPTPPVQWPAKEEGMKGISGLFRWYVTEVLTSHVEPPSLPSWLEDYEPSPIAESRTKLKRTKPRGLASAIVPADYEGTPEGKVKFTKGLSSCNNLVEIRELLRSLNLSGKQISSCSRLAFAWLLDTRMPLQTLLDFLDDASLNALEARNLQRLLCHLAGQPRNDQDAETLGNWMRKHVSLGRLPEKEIRSILNSVRNPGSAAYHDHLGPIIAVMVWDGLQSSSVLRPLTLEVRTLNTLLEHISRNEWSSRVQSVGNSIVKSVAMSQFSHMQSGISAFMRSWLSATRSSTNLGRQELPSPEDHVTMVQFLGILPTEVAIATLGMVITKELLPSPSTSRECQSILADIMHLLEILPADTAKSSVADATRKVCLSHQQALKKGRGGIELLEPWLRTLSKSDVFRRSIFYSAEWRTFEKSLSDRTMETLYLRALGDRERCIYILRHWALEDAAAEQFGGAESVASDALRRFEGLNKAEHGTAPYGHMLRALGAHTKSFDTVLPRLFSLLASLGETQTAVNIIRRMQEYRLPIDARMVSFVIREYCRVKPASALTLFESHPGLSLAGCPELAESLIADPETGPDTVFRHLDRRPKAVSNRVSTYHDPSHLSKAQIRLLHRMALAFANAAHLEPRIAFRFVHRCYTFLKNGSGGDLGPQLSRALTVAGVIRPLQAGQWVSTMKLKWILALVEHIEGEKVATELDETLYEWRGRVVRVNQAKFHHARAYGPPTSLFGPEA